MTRPAAELRRRAVERSRKRYGGPLRMIDYVCSRCGREGSRTNRPGPQGSTRELCPQCEAATAT